jgi:hypothetical protein
MTPTAHALAERLALPAPARDVLDYLHHHLPGYPFDPDIDLPFVQELHNDFPHLDLLEQIKLFRWYHDNQPPLDNRPRITLRRWIGRARLRRSP